MKRTDLAYLAGIVDGVVVSNKECTICGTKRYRLVISREYA